MLTQTFHSIATAARNVFSDWRSMFLFAIVYASLLTTLYFFLAVREASIVQVSLTFALAIAAPVLFFLLQAMIANGIANGGIGSNRDQLSVSSLLKKSLTSFWKLVLISLPLIAFAVLIAYLLGKAQAHFGASLNNPVNELPHPMVTMGRARDVARLIDWKAATLTGVRYLAFGLLLPLAAIHLWLATVREGLGHAITKLKHHLSRAFAPQSVLIYLVGFVVFGVAPYLLLFRTTPTKHAWLEISLLVARLAIVFGLTLFGWVITVRALALFPTNPPSHPANEAA